MGFMSSLLTRSSRIEVSDEYKGALSKYNISLKGGIIKFTIADSKIDKSL